MYKRNFIISLLLLLVLNGNIFPQIDFDTYFDNKTLRIDYFHTGNDTMDIYSLDELIEEPFWGGGRKNLLDQFNYGVYKIEVYDNASNNLIYSKSYSSLFHEWQTTPEAKKIIRSFTETVIIPFPKNTIRVEFFSRDKKTYDFIKKFEVTVDPLNYFIKKERRLEFPTFETHLTGNPANKVDIVILPDGYTEEEMELFRKDCEKFTGYLFNSSPFRENKDKFNVRGVSAPSKESGIDIPGKNIWKNTILSSNFYTFDIERYLMTENNKAVRDLASNAPYDQIYILVNTNIYGGGAIYNHYSMCMNSNLHEEYVFVHEFGHGFASLADEYFTSEVAYEDFYNLQLEPIDPNLTTLVDFESKWKDLVEEGTPIPTPAGSKYADKIGAFEGGGYVEKGIYRPKLDCTMKTATIDNFCPVCYRSIEKMINFIAEEE
jgi:hypothetical protein